jgi:hypothetical protein
MTLKKKILERHEIPKLIQEEQDNLSSPIPIKEIKLTIKLNTFPQKKSCIKVASLELSTNI